METYVSPGDHVYSRQVHFHEDRVLENFVREIKSQNIAKEAEAVANGTILTAERVVGREIEHDVLLAQFSLPGKPINVVLGMLKETARGGRASIREEPFLKPKIRDIDSVTLHSRYRVFGRTLWSSRIAWYRRRNCRPS